MNTVELLQSSAGTLYLVTITVVGIRLARLALRTRALPEALLGGALLLGGTLGGPLEALGHAGDVNFSPAAAGRFILAGKLFGLFAISFHVGFIWLVFRRDEAWAGLLSLALVAGPVATIWGYGASGVYSGASLPAGWFSLDLVPRLVAALWMSFEGYRYYKLMRLRRALGLADALLTNRFLLWTLSGFVSLAFLLTAVPPLFLDAVRDEVLLTADLLVFSVAGVGVSILYFLTFFPPQRYRRYLERRAQAAS